MCVCTHAYVSGFSIDGSQEDQKKKKKGETKPQDLDFRDGNMRALDSGLSIIITAILKLSNDPMQKEDCFFYIEGAEVIEEDVYLLKYLDNGEQFWVPETTMT